MQDALNQHHRYETDMTELHPTSGRQLLPGPFPKTGRVTETVERRSIGRTSHSTPRQNRSIHRDWVMFVIWSFVVLSFAAFFFAGYIILLKCHSHWSY